MKDNKHYFISEFGDIRCVEDFTYLDNVDINKLKSAGNYFDSVEEANKRLGIDILLSAINKMPTKSKNITYGWREVSIMDEHPGQYKFSISIELYGSNFLRGILDKIFIENLGGEDE